MYYILPVDKLQLVPDSVDLVSAHPHKGVQRVTVLL